jgi:hypothetical protein
LQLGEQTEKDEEASVPVDLDDPFMATLARFVFKVVDSAIA